MSGYTPQVGDRVVVEGETAIVIGIDDDVAWIKWELESYRTTIFVKNLTKVPESVVYPERWINVYPNGIGVGHHDRRFADRERGSNRIAVIHLAADGTLTLHPVERES